MGVEDRQAMQQHVVRREGPGVLQDARVRQQVLMAQHRPLGAPGGP